MNKGDKCFNCNKQAGHIVKDCADLKKNSKSSTRETGIFVGSGYMTTRIERSNLQTISSKQKLKGSKTVRRTVKQPQQKQQKHTDFCW
jgi:hypothetical protein